jgi:aryl-alcohol dehydrogenase-like predicted oxidoreductase
MPRPDAADRWPVVVKHRSLGGTGLAVSEIGFGCGTTAGLMIGGTPETRRAAVARALELGINYFDTAPGYGNTRSETNLGQTLVELGARPIVATKVALSLEDCGDIAGFVVRSVEASLVRLRLESVPLVHLHNRVGERRAAKGDFGTGALLTVDDVLGPAGVVAGMQALRKRGLLQFFGCCAYGGDMTAVERLIDSGEFASILVNYSALNATAWSNGQPGVRDYHQVGRRAADSGMATVALRVLEGGVLSGDLATGPPNPSVNPNFAAMQAKSRGFYDLCAGAGLSVAEAATRYALSNPQVSTVLLGFSDLRQVEEAAQTAAHGPLSAEMLTTIKGLQTM